ncbi:MAG: DUF4838 domain-containing protein [Bacteroidaceae bacterium]|nr:DUF4838 domain-containing protein [Bacteroidaceae bacterium]
MMLQACHSVLAFTDDSPFEYREIYLPESDTDEARELGLNNVNNDWGIWGHHLAVVLPKGPSPSVFATIGGRMSEDQFCFSSDRLYDYIADYINDIFGEKQTQRFAILPQDNNIVCQCEACRAIGCTPGNATPAVQAMLERLAARFPKHIFFTSHYLTTRSVPDHAMPSNTGVLISAFDYPFCTAATPQEHTFEELLSRWHDVCPHIYIWDYINNYDDYFTPFPATAAMQRRLQLYARCGVDGIFLNGSGTDYSTFSRVKTHVLAQLLKDPELAYQRVFYKVCKELYPVTGELISDFLLCQEDLVWQRERPLPLYEGVAAARKSYLDEEAFTLFQDSLMKLLPRATGLERKEVGLACRAMLLTRLELKRIHGDTEGCQPMLSQLASVVHEGARIYSESFWSVESYISDYRAMLDDAKRMEHKNRLRGVPLTALTGLDDEYRDLSILTDGLAGLPSNYHCGQLLSSADPWLRLAIPNNGLRHLRVGLTSNVQFHIAPPLRVTLSEGDREIGSVVPQAQTGVAQRTTVDFDIPANATGTLILTLVRNKEERTMAIDEVYGW